MTSTWQRIQTVLCQPRMTHNRLGRPEATNDTVSRLLAVWVILVGSACVVGGFICSVV